MRVTRAAPAVAVGLVLALIATVVASPAVSAAELSPTATGKPNIVVIMLDDLGAIDHRVLVRLPTIKATFLDQGVEFTDFHTETPTCCPGRAGFFTGLHTHNHGVTRNYGPLFKPGMTIATQLRRSGYYTAFAGKYLNSYEAVTPKHPPGWSEFHGITQAYYDYPIWSNGKRRWRGHRASDYSTDVIGNKILGALSRAPGHRRLFAMLAPYAVHSPIRPARRHKDDPRCDDIPYWKPPNYMELDVRDKPLYVRRQKRTSLAGKKLGPTCRAMLAVDDVLRKVRARLKRQGRLSNTLFVLTSDHGMNYGAPRFPRDKKTPYSTQVPFLTSWKKRLGTTHRVVRERLQNIDVAPTLCAIAGCSLGPYPTGQRSPDGRSFKKLLLGATSRLERTAVLSSFRTRGAIVPPWFGVTSTWRSSLAWKGCELAASGGCRWQWVEYDSGARELYDISNGPCHSWKPGQAGDPCRLQNLAGRSRYDGIKKVLRQRLRTLKKQ